MRVLLASIESKCSLPSHSATLSSTLKLNLKCMLCMYVMVLCNISPIIFIYFFFLEKERVRDKEGGGGGWVVEQRFTCI